MKSVKYFSIAFFVDRLIPWAEKVVLFIVFFVYSVSVFSSSYAEPYTPVLPPVAICKNITVQLGPGGSVTVNASDIDAGSYDPDGTIVSMIISQATFDCAHTGSNSVTLTVTDNEGKSSSCIAMVTVEDRIKPSVFCKDVIVYLDAAGNATISPADIDQGSSDNCTAALFFFLSRTDFSCSDTGSPVNIVLTGLDESGNSSSCSSSVTVLDTISPSIRTKPYTLVIGSSGSATLTAADVDNGSFDNCGSVNLTISPDHFTCSDLGQQIVTISATDSYGNISKKDAYITVSSTVRINAISLSSCELSPTLAVFESDKEGGNGVYSYLWKGINPASEPFMVIIPFPPSLHFSNSSILEEPFFNNTMPDGYYGIGLTLTDGNGCRDSAEIKINKTGAIFNNLTVRSSEACEGEVKSYSVLFRPDATYNWSVTNGTVLNSDPDTNTVSILWNLGISEGRVLTTINEPNALFPGGHCESTVIDSVSVSTLPTPVFDNPVTNACHHTPTTYTLTETYVYHNWTVTGGIVLAGGTLSDNFVTVSWNNGPAGTVSVSAGNNLLCSGSASINVTIYNLSGSVISVSDISCSGGSDGSVTVTADAGTGMPPYSFSLDGGPNQAGGTFTGLTLGNHIVRVQDNFSCYFDVPFVINQPEPVAVSVSSFSNISCYGGSDGSVTISSSGGTPPYQYSVNGGPLQPSGVFNGLTAGSYVFKAEDSNGCTGIFVFSLVQPSQPLAGAASVTDVLCFGESTGRIELTVTGGTPPYSYLWDNGSSSEDLLNVIAGSYTVIITDANGCTETVNAVVSQPSSALSGTAVVSDVLCFGESTGSVNLTVTGGTSPYTYLWNTGATSEDILNLFSGNYSVEIRDSNGCTASVNVTVSQPLSALGATVSSINNVSCHGGNDGSVSIAATGGTGPYEYRFESGAFQPSGLFESLSEGTYGITVRDANLCTYTLAVTVTQPSSALSGYIEAQADIDCYGNETGSVNVLGTGGTSPYEYSLDGGAFQSFGFYTDLPGGAHIVTIRDLNQCTFLVNVTIVEPLLPLAATTLGTDVLCKGESTGTATVNVTGGTAPYTYKWNSIPAQTDQTATGLPAGTYLATVIDNNGCLTTGSVVINEPVAGLSGVIAVTDATCNGGSDGALDLTVENGLAPFTFLWSNGALTEDLSGLSEADYSVTITDGNGCNAVVTATVGQPDILSGTASISNVSCFSGSNGSCDLTINGGTQPYLFLWDNGAVTEDVSGLSAGNHTVIITDSQGCTLVINVVVSQPSSPLNGSVASVTDVSVYGGNDGSITVTATGGTTPYGYSIDGGAYQASGIFGSLSAGTYQIRVIDANSCTFDLSVTVSQPWIPLTASVTDIDNVKCFGGSDGSVTVAGAGGTPPYMYSFNGGTYQASGTFPSLSPGTYTIIVRDGVSDTYNQPFTISEPESLSVFITATSAQCGSSSSGTGSAVPSGGTAPYYFLWNTTPQQTTPVATGLTAGTYSVTVTDANGCSVTGNVEILHSLSDLALTFSKTDVLCGGGETGTSTVIVAGGMPPYTYEWDTTPVQTSQTAAGLAEGTYMVTVTDSYGCTGTGTVTINGSPALNVEYSSTDASCPDSNDGTVSLTISGGNGPYSIFWSDGAGVQNRTNLLPGRYGVVVTDQNGCAGSLIIDIEFTFSYNCLVIPQVLTPNGDGFNDEWIIRNIDMYPEAEVHIFNRWGQEVFTTRNLADNPWDGRYKGKLVPTDSYHYILYLHDGSDPKTGVISVIR